MRACCCAFPAHSSSANTSHFSCRYLASHAPVDLLDLRRSLQLLQVRARHSSLKRLTP